MACLALNFFMTPYPPAEGFFDNLKGGADIIRAPFF